MSGRGKHAAQRRRIERAVALDLAVLVVILLTIAAAAGGISG